MKTLFFDLFWTLIQPLCNYGRGEHDILGITQEEWFKYSEMPCVADERYLGFEKNEFKILQKITKLLPFNVDDKTVQTLLDLRLERIKNALLNVNPVILSVLSVLKKKGFNLCIISNADSIDIHYWNDSPLKNLFDDVIFSCNTGIIKPDTDIYKLAINRLNADPKNCLYIGDGGSNELAGAKNSGLKTVLTEHFVVKNNEIRRHIINDADYIIKDFNELISIVESI